MRIPRSIEWTARAAAVILAVGATALALVLTRHARLQAAHELTQSRRRVVELERDLRRVRARLAEQHLPATDADPTTAEPAHAVFGPREGTAE